MMQKITLEEAIILWVNTLETKVALCKSDLVIFLYNIKASKKYKNFEISGVRKDSNIESLYRKTINFLENSNLIKSTGYDYFILLNKEHLNPLEMVCSVYPYGYISFLSAMQYYELTARNDKSINFIIPSRKEWKLLELNRISQNILDKEELNFKNLEISYPNSKIRFNRRKLIIKTRKNFSPDVETSNSLRIIDIGHLFLEMLHYPENCGGFDEVLEVFTKFAEKYSNEIILATNKSGTKLDKSKIGFILEKFLKIKNNEFSKWKETSVMRGGSRKMLANVAYSKNYSEEWCLSLNHPKFSEY